MTALGMVVCEFIVAIISVTDSSKPAVSANISFICIYIFFFATTWGPGAWVVIGEVLGIQASVYYKRQYTHIDASEEYSGRRLA